MLIKGLARMRPRPIRCIGFLITFFSNLKRRGNSRWWSIVNVLLLPSSSKGQTKSPSSKLGNDRLILFHFIFITCMLRCTFWLPKTKSNRYKRASFVNLCILRHSLTFFQNCFQSISIVLSLHLVQKRIAIKVIWLAKLIKKWTKQPNMNHQRPKLVRNRRLHPSIHSNQSRLSVDRQTDPVNLSHIGLIYRKNISVAPPFRCVTSVS